MIKLIKENKDNRDDELLNEINEFLLKICNRLGLSVDYSSKYDKLVSNIYYLIKSYIRSK